MILFCLDVPTPPTIKLTPNKRSIRLDWSVNPSNDEGTITLYNIEFLNITELRKYGISGSIQNKYGTFNFLKPYTNYTVRMNAVSMVGVGLWSSINTIQTLIAGKNSLID